MESVACPPSLSLSLSLSLSHTHAHTHHPLQPEAAPGKPRLAEESVRAFLRSLEPMRGLPGDLGQTLKKIQGLAVKIYPGLMPVVQVRAVLAVCAMCDLRMFCGLVGHDLGFSSTD